MKIGEVITMIILEIGDTLSFLAEEDVNQFIKKILSSKRIFIAGAGRSGVFVRAFAMRLMQMDFTVYVVGETTTPSIEAEDLLVIISGSGETEHSCFILKNAKKVGAYTYLITAHQVSPMWKIAQGKIRIPGPTKLSSLNKGKSQQFIGSLFEQGAFIFLESVIHKLRTKIKMNSEEIMIRHANLE